METLGNSLLSALGNLLPATGTRPQPEMTLTEVTHARSEWELAAKFASTCCGHIVTAAGETIGSGVLVGVDCLLVPLHLVQTGAPHQFSVHFEDQNGSNHIYKFATFREFNARFDYCIVQLEADANNRHAGEAIPIPEVSQGSARELLLVHQKEGKTIFSLSQTSLVPIPTSAFTFSFSSTHPGSSGGCLFTKNGKLVSMHLGRDKAGESPKQRVSVTLKDVYKSSSILSSPLTKPMSPPTSREALPAFKVEHPSVELEGKGKNRPEIYYSKDLKEVYLKEDPAYYLSYYEVRSNGLNRSVGLNIYEKTNKSWKNIHTAEHSIGDPHADPKYSKYPAKTYRKEAGELFKAFIKERTQAQQKEESHKTTPTVKTRTS